MYFRYQSAIAECCGPMRLCLARRYRLTIHIFLCMQHLPRTNSWTNRCLTPHVGISALHCSSPKHPFYMDISCEMLNAAWKALSCYIPLYSQPDDSPLLPLYREKPTKRRSGPISMESRRQFCGSLYETGNIWRLWMYGLWVALEWRCDNPRKL
jgi:hypothetical protein